MCTKYKVCVYNYMYIHIDIVMWHSVCFPVLCVKILILMGMHSVGILIEDNV